MLPGENVDRLKPDDHRAPELASEVEERVFRDLAQEPAKEDEDDESAKAAA